MDRVKISTFNINFFYPIPLALSLLILRRFLEKFCFMPIGIAFKIPAPKFVQNVHIIPAFKNTLGLTKLLSPTQVYTLSKYLDFSGSFYRQTKAEKITKFCKSAWNFTFFLYAFIHGMVILWDKPWFWNISECWTDFFQQKITTDIWIYYIVCLAYYWSLLITVLLGVRRKDFQENVIHHCVAISLIYISLIWNAFRIGTIVLVVLGVSDIFLEGAKMAKYLNLKKVCDSTFGMFTIVWVISRLGFYPFWIIRTTIFDVPNTLPKGLPYYVCNSLLLALVALNIFWTVMIFKALWKALTEGKVEDSRSDSESED